MSDQGWSRTFDDPIALPDGGELRTLRDAATYITKLPKREHETFAWRAAIQGADAGRRAWWRHHAAEDRDHAGVVSWRDGADAEWENIGWSDKYRSSD